MPKFTSDYKLKVRFIHHRQTPACMIVYGNKTVKLSFIRGDADAGTGYSEVYS
jgi:hypothetical protein